MITKFLITKKFRARYEKKLTIGPIYSPWCWKNISPPVCDICGELLPSIATYYFVISHHKAIMPIKPEYEDWCLRIYSSQAHMGSAEGVYKAFFIHGPHKPCKDLLPLRY